MRKLIVVSAMLMLITSTAYAQLGGILNRIDPSKIKKGVKVATAATKDFTEEEEIDLGRVVSARILATYPLAKNERLQEYVTLVGNTVALYSSRPALPWHFAVLDTPDVNAFAAPGGYIFVTSGALSNMSSEAELAAVLGHEVAHVTEKHILKEIKRANVFSAGVDAVAASYGSGGLTDELAKKISNLANEKLFKTGIGRKEELESDRIGVQLADAAGYRASAYLEFLEALEGLSEAHSSAFATLGATHPKPADRAKSLHVSRDDKGQLLQDRWGKWVKF